MGSSHDVIVVSPIGTRTRGIQFHNPGGNIHLANYQIKTSSLLSSVHCTWEYVGAVRWLKALRRSPGHNIHNLFARWPLWRKKAET